MQKTSANHALLMLLAGHSKKISINAKEKISGATLEILFRFFHVKNLMVFKNLHIYFSKVVIPNFA